MGRSKVVYGGETLIDLTGDNISADKMFVGTTAHGADGEPIAGEFTLDAELSAQDALIAQIQTALQGKAAGGASENLDDVLSEQEALIARLQGILAEKASGGSSETYKRLIEEGILRDSEMSEMPANLCRNWYYIKEVDVPNVKRTGGYVFYSCTNLEKASMPKCEEIGAYGFYNCTNLKVIDFPKLTSIQGNTFRQCTDVTTVNIPECTSLGANAFQKLGLIENLDFPLLVSIGATAFDQCSSLTAVILRKNSVCSLVNKSAFNSTPIASGTGYIYVPAALVDSYKAATNWSSFAAQIRAIEDYPEICGG